MSEDFGEDGKLGRHGLVYSHIKVALLIQRHVTDRDKNGWRDISSPKTPSAMLLE